MDNARYRKLKKWKYQLVTPYTVPVGIGDYDIDTGYVKLSPGGLLTVSAFYAWDGPSGPTIDTADFMRGSLVHDALYQLIRMEKLPWRYREYADLLLKKHCLEDGMCSFRATYVYLAVRCFGAAAARPGTEPPAKTFCFPPGKTAS
jgi:hypothetical protein